MSSINIISFIRPSLFIVLVLLILFTLLLKYLWPEIVNYRRRNRILANVPGVPPVGYLYYLIGNIDRVFYYMRHLSPSKVLYQSMSIVYSNKTFNGGIIWFYMGWKHSVVFSDAKSMETLLSSNVNITKSNDYNKMDQWLGKGLLTSTGDHWRRHRKVLTPAFHFRILDSFVPILNQCSKEMNKLIEREEGCVPIDIRSYVTNCTLDTICETAMGVRVDAQSGSGVQYVQPLKRIMELVIERVVNPLYKSDLIFSLLPISREFRKNLQIVHRFVSGVIQKRRQEMEQTIQNNSINLNSVLTESDELSLLGDKKRYAFLDTLLLQHFRSPESFTVQDIEDEVNTFMFEGHDTTAAGLTFALLLIGENQQVQDKIYEELESIFGEEMARPISTEDCRQMKYLEMCIKESLRLYPPVPMIARKIEHDFQIENYTIPASSQCIVYIYSLHRDPSVFPKPEHFIPERFAPDAEIHRQPYAYLPFSAGPRNCIGQKFAMLEMKIVIASVLRQFRLRSITKRDQIDIEFPMVIKANTPIFVEFQSRK